MSREIKIYATTLRDGAQSGGVSLSMEDKVQIAQRLDALGIHYIECGWPGSNPKDRWSMWQAWSRWRPPRNANNTRPVAPR
jgi:2-isopropylmalate synthase